MIIETRHDQALDFTARLGVAPINRYGTSGGEAKAEIVLEFARASAPKAWAESPEDERGPEPIVRVDLSARAKAAGVDVKDVIAALRADPVFSALEKRGRLVVSG